MLASFIAWWIARITELLPKSWKNAAAGAPDGVVANVDEDQNIRVAIRRRGQEQELTLAAAARLAARKPVWLRPSAETVLEKQHLVPTASRRELTLLLRHEFSRITPFDADDLFWGWEGRPKSGDKTRTDVTLTMVPKIAVGSALDFLANAGIRPRFIETGPAEHPRLLPIDGERDRSAGPRLIRFLAWISAGLAVTALLLPVLLQELALRATDRAIDKLQPAIKQVEALRRGITAEGAGRELLAHEMERTGDILQVLATVTRILPDDTYLTDFSLRERQMLLGGRSAAAARLITALSADPAIRDAAFAAPVTRVEGASADIFSIRAGVAP